MLHKQKSKCNDNYTEYKYIHAQVLKITKVVHRLITRKSYKYNYDSMHT